MSDTGSEVVLGWRLGQHRSAGLVFGLDIEGARRESAGEAAGHRFGVGLGWRLEGAGREGFEVRFGGARVEPADDDVEHRIGATLTARW